MPTAAYEDGPAPVPAIRHPAARGTETTGAIFRRLHGVALR